MLPPYRATHTRSPSLHLWNASIFLLRKARDNLPEKYSCETASVPLCRGVDHNDLRLGVRFSRLAGRIPSLLHFHSGKFPAVEPMILIPLGAIAGIAAYWLCLACLASSHHGAARLQPEYRLLPDIAFALCGDRRRRKLFRRFPHRKIPQTPKAVNSAFLGVWKSLEAW
jgi:hypothetical protein